MLSYHKPEIKDKIEIRDKDKVTDKEIRDKDEVTDKEIRGKDEVTDKEVTDKNRKIYIPLWAIRFYKGIRLVKKELKL